MTDNTHYITWVYIGDRKSSIIIHSLESHIYLQTVCLDHLLASIWYTWAKILTTYLVMQCVSHGLPPLVPQSVSCLLPPLSGEEEKNMLEELKYILQDSNRDKPSSLHTRYTPWERPSPQSAKSSARSRSQCVVEGPERLCMLCYHGHPTIIMCGI